MLVKLLIGIGLLVGGFFALVGFLHLTRTIPLQRVRAHGERNGTPGVEDPFFCDLVGMLTRTTLFPGHAVHITTCGDQTYPALWEDLRRAERSITIQLYYCQPGRMADEFKEIVMERARAGVKVLFLTDSVGAGPLPGEYFDELKAAGVHCAMFRPKRIWEVHKLQNRSHIRVVVVDGSIGWTGGFGLDDKWYGDGRHKDQWRDSNVRFEGPAVLQHQATFAAAWAEATGTLLTGAEFFPAHERHQHDGDIYAGMLHASPTIGSTVAERFVALSIAAARRRLYITNSYFVPNDEQRELIVDAAKRGCEVRILTCNEEGDVKSTYYAGRRHYERLLGAGVRIFEYQPAMMHAKSLVVDGLFGAVGTMNFDNQSMSHNDETMLLARDRGFGSTLERIFHEDLEHSREIRLAEFRRRPFREKVLERGFDLVSRIL